MPKLTSKRKGERERELSLAKKKDDENNEGKVKLEVDNLCRQSWRRLKFEMGELYLTRAHVRDSSKAFLQDE